MFGFVSRDYRSAIDIDGQQASQFACGRRRRRLKKCTERLVLFDGIGGVLKKITLNWRKLDFDVVNFCASTMLQDSSKCSGLFEGWVSFQCMFLACLTCFV